MTTLHPMRPFGTNIGQERTRTMPLTHQEAQDKLGAFLTGLLDETGDGMVLDWQLAVVTMSVEDIDGSNATYQMFGSSMHYHTALGLATWALDAVEERAVEPDGEDRD